MIAYREENGKFTQRKQLLKVPKLGAKAYEQCAGFLRIRDGKNILDNTAVHPESYEATEKLLALFGYTDDDVKNRNLKDLPEKIKKYGEKKAADECGLGVPTMNDIVTELLKPGRDVRDSLPKPELRSDIMDINDLKVGMELTGTVRNVIDFGAFIDIGVHQDGLVHISEISDGYVKHPSDVLKVGQVVKVRVLSVEPKKNRIGLTMRKNPGKQGCRKIFFLDGNTRRKRPIPLSHVKARVLRELFKNEKTGKIIDKSFSVCYNIEKPFGGTYGSLR